MTDGDNTYVFDTDIDIREWMPGKHVNCAVMKLPADIMAGNYKVEIGIMNDHIPQIYFATDAENDGAYYVVGVINIK